MDRPIDKAKTMKPQMIRVPQAIQMLGMSRTTFYRRRDEGIFSVIKRGSLSYVPTHQIEAYLDPSAEQLGG